MANTNTQNWFKVELLLAHSCLILRKLFKNRWLLFTGQPWQDTVNDGQIYITSVGQNVYKNCGNIQKAMLKGGDTNQWDLTTLIMVLRETKPKKRLDKSTEQNIAAQNNDLSKIANIRNVNAHHPSKSLSNTEFEPVWSQLSSILISLGGDTDEIEKLKLDVSDMTQPQELINSENTAEAKRLKDLGNEAYKQKNFNDAIKWYSQALVLAGLSDYDRSILFSNRAAAYLEKRDASELKSYNDCRYLALKDAEHARDLRQAWPKAYHRIGQAYMALGDFEKALHSFEKGLALDPTNAEIKNARDFALEENLYYERQDHLFPQNMPRTTREQLHELSKKTGSSIEEQEKMLNMLRKLDPAKDAVFKGHQYRDGDDNVKQNYEQAVRFYAKAVNLGSAEGMYNLALLHMRGLGVKQDMQTAIQLLKQAAEQCPTMYGTSCIPNVGVAEAEHSLGLRYETGVGVEMNYQTAAEWYQRAVDHGSATAANNLGLMYGNGVGVPRDLVKSEQLLRLAAARGDPNAPMNLAGLFFAKDDFQMAEHWCKCASENNNLLAKEQLKEYQNKAEQERELFKKLDVESWEKQNALNTHNMTYNERIQRKLSAEDPRVASAHSVVQDLKNMFLSVKPVPQPIKKTSRLFDPVVVEKYAKMEFKFAQRLLEAQMHFFKAMQLLLDGDVNNNDKEAQFIRELSASIKIEHIVVQIPEPLRDKIKLTVDRVINRCNSTRSELDENARVCYSFLHMNSLESTIEFLTVCNRMYPKSHFFLELRGSLYGFLNKFEQGLTDINSALQLAPNDVTFLYDRAAMLRLVEHSIPSETIAAYNAFLKSSSIDHRKVPEAFYAIAQCYLLNHENARNEKLAEEYYEKGIEAEKHQLPFFLPYESNNKLLLSKLFQLKSKITTGATPELIVDTEKPKTRLSDPRRIDIIRSHRQAFADKREDLLKNQKPPSSTFKPPLHQRSPASLIGLKEIVLREMDLTKDRIYQGYVLSGIIFEQSPVVEPSLWLLIEDGNGDLERLFIYNLPPSEACQLIKDTYIYGAKLSILNPYMRMARDGKPAIRVDDVSSIILHGDTHNLKNMCRCCGKTNAPHVCGKCKTARYCSLECQRMDWKQYDHKLICV